MTPPSARPNIVIVHAHDLGRHLGCYGRPVATPAIDRLAAEGARFENHFCPAPQCSPSRASMATGRYPHNNGMLGLAHLDWQLDDPGKALPWKLKELGYATYLFGEQHEATSSDLLGYDHAIGTEWPQLARELGPQFASRLAELDRSSPFFASIGFFEAHRPFDHPGYVDDDPDDVEVPPYLPDTPEVRLDIAGLHGRVKAVDEGLRTVVEALDAHGLRDDTLLIFTADHGIAFPRAKGTLYDPGLEVALLLRWPGVVPPWTSVRDLLCNVDLFPTLLEIAGGELGEDLDGQSFLPRLRGEPYQSRDHFMCEMTWHDRYAPVRGIRTQRWKYIRHFQDRDGVFLPADVEDSPSGRAYRELPEQEPTREELYDLIADPHELTNLAGDPPHRPTTAELRRRVEEWMRDTNDPLLEDAAS